MSPTNSCTETDKGRFSPKGENLSQKPSPMQRLDKINYRPENRKRCSGDAVNSGESNCISPNSPSKSFPRTTSSSVVAERLLIRWPGIPQLRAQPQARSVRCRGLLALSSHPFHAWASGLCTRRHEGCRRSIYPTKTATRLRKLTPSKDLGRPCSARTPSGCSHLWRCLPGDSTRNEAFSHQRLVALRYPPVPNYFSKYA